MHLHRLRNILTLVVSVLSTITGAGLLCRKLEEGERKEVRVIFLGSAGGNFQGEGHFVDDCLKLLCW